MIKRKFLTKATSIALSTALLIGAVPVNPVFAANTGNTSLDIEIIPCNVDISLPSSVVCTIDPNQVNPEDRFMYGDLNITNNGTAPVDVSVTAFTDIDNTFENNITPDGLPEGKEWDKLSVSDTSKYFALGIKANGSSNWGNTNLTDFIYVPEVVEPNLVGTLNSGEAGKMDLDASFGLNFKTAKNFSYEVVFNAELSQNGGNNKATSYTIDKEATTPLNYELTPTGTGSINLNSLLGIDEVYAAPTKGTVDETKVVGTAYVTGVKDASTTDIYVADYYEATDGNLYKIIGIKEGSENNYTVSGETIKNIELAPTVTEIGDYGVGDCENLENLIVKSEELTVGTNNFEQCNNIENIITVKETVKETLVQKVEIITPEKTTVCASKKELDQKVEEIKNGIINAITLDPGLYDINNNQLATWNELVNEYGLDISRILTEDELYEIDENENYPAYSLNSILSNNENLESATKLVIDNSVTSIGNSAFLCCENLTSVIIPNSVTTIGESAFAGCTSLTNIEIPNSVISIGESVFDCCENLEEVTFAENSQLTTIGEEVFSYTGLTSITLPSTITSIGDYAFTHCDLTNIEIPSSVTSIGIYAFSGCSSLETVTFAENSQLTTIGNNAFAECKALTNIEIPDSVTSIGNYAFSGCSSLETVTFAENSQLTSIGEWAFYECENLEEITFAENSQLTTIGRQAFRECTSLTNITLPSTVTDIGDGAFYQVPQITYSGNAEGSPWGALSVVTQ